MAQAKENIYSVSRRTLNTSISNWISKEITNSSSEINYINQPKFHSKVQSKDFWMDNKKIQELGFKQTIFIEEIIRELCL